MAVRGVVFRGCFDVRVAGALFRGGLAGRLYVWLNVSFACS